jgi:tetratricopeptide (TPR) repeat protein
VRAEALFGACAINAAAGEFEAARRFGVRRAEVTRALGDDAETASALQSLANVSVHLGDRAEAARLYEEAAAHARAAGNRPALAAIVNNHGYLELLAGDAEAALASCSEAASLFAELEKPALGAGARLNVATALVALDRPAEAAAELGRALDAYLELEYEEGVSYCLDVAAAASLAQGDARAAASLASAAAALREKSGVAPEPVEQRLHEETVTAARSELGDDAFADAAREGAALPLDSLVTSLVLPA